MANDFARQMAQIAKTVALGRYRYTIHGAAQRIARNIQGHEVEEAIINGEIIEHYPVHHYGAACLILGKTKKGRFLHILCSMQPVVDIITIYEPDPNEWMAGLKTRR